MATITQQDIDDGAADLQTMEDVANGGPTFGGDGLVHSRLGQDIKTLAKVIADLASVDVGASAAAAINQRLSSREEFADETAFLAGTSNGQYGYVGTQLFKNETGSATPVTDDELLNLFVALSEEQTARTSADMTEATAREEAVLNLLARMSTRTTYADAAAFEAAVPERGYGYIGTQLTKNVSGTATAVANDELRELAVSLAAQQASLDVLENDVSGLQEDTSQLQTDVSVLQDYTDDPVRSTLVFGEDVDDYVEGDTVEVDKQGRVIRLGAFSQIDRVDRDVDAVEQASGRWTLTFDQTLEDYDEVRTDAAGRIVSGSSALFNPGMRWTLTFSDELSDFDVLNVDAVGRVLSGDTFGIGAGPSDQPVPDLSERMLAYASVGVADEAAAWRADMDTNGAPAEDPDNSPELTLIMDAATIASYLPMVNRMDPIITQCHRSGRVWRAYYGNNGPLGTDPEHPGHDMFMLLEYTEDFADGGVSPPASDNETDDVTWKQVAIIHYSVDDDALVQDGQFFYTHQGYLVFAMALKITGKLQVSRAWVIQNPDTGEAADLDGEIDSTFVFGPQTFFGYGFVFQGHLLGTEHRYFMSGFPATTFPRDKDKIPRYCRLRIYEERVQGVVSELRAYSEVISEVPAMLDSEAEDFPEPTAVPVGGDELMMSFRADAKAMERRSYDGGLSWSEETDSYLERVLESTRSKTVLCRSPSGRLLWAFNNNGTRFNMSVLLSYKGSDGADEKWLASYLIDGRARPLVTYPSVVFLRDTFGRYHGKFLVAYDRGRSRTYIGQSGGEVAAGTPGSTTWNELITTLMDEEATAVAAPDAFVRYTTNPGVPVPA